MQHLDSPLTCELKFYKSLKIIHSHSKLHVSWFDLKTCSKVVKDGAIGHNAYDFLLVFYSNCGRISYRFNATVVFLPK